MISANMRQKRWIAVIVAWALALAATLPTFRYAPAQAQEIGPLAVESTAAEWPLWRQNPQNTGRQTTGVGNITAPAIRWAQYLGGVPPTIVADLNQDGKQDVVSIIGSQVVAREINGEYLWISDPIPAAFGLRAADLDGQSGPEVVVASDSLNRLFVLRGNNGQVAASIQTNRSGCGGLLHEIVNFPTSSANNQISDLLVWAGETGPFIVYSFANGIGTPTPIFTSTVIPNSCTTMYRALDAEGDGFPELLATNYSPHRFNVWNNNGSLRGTTPGSYGSFLWGNYSVNDTNGDNRQDAFFFGTVANFQAGIIALDILPASVITRWQYLLPTGGQGYAFGHPNSAARFNTSNSAFQVAAGLFNDWTGSSYTGRIDAALFDAISGVRVLTIQNERLVSVADADNDGRRDLITVRTAGLANSIPWRTRIYQFDGSSAIVLQTIMNAQPAWNDIVEVDNNSGTREMLVWHDGNADNRPEALVGVQVPQGTRLYTYTFPAEVRVTSIITITDMDGNGRPDIVVGSSDGYIDRLEVSGNQLVRRTPRLVGGGHTTQPLAAVWNSGVHVLAGNSRGHSVVLNATAATLNIPPTQVLTYNTTTDPRRLLGILDFGGSIGRARLLIDSTSQAPSSTLSLMDQADTLRWTRLITDRVDYFTVGAVHPSGPERDVVLIGYNNQPAEGYTVMVVDGADGSIRWRQFFPILPSAGTYIYQPGLADLNADGTTDVFANVNLGGGIYGLWGFSGLNGTRVFTGDLSTIGTFGHQPPMATDWNGNGRPEISINEWYLNIGAFESPASPQPSTPTYFVWSTTLPQRIIGAANAIAISGTRTLLIHPRNGGVLFAIDMGTGQAVYTKTLGALGSTPAVLSGIQTGVGEGNVMALAVANIDGTPGEEVLVASENGWLYALDATNPQGPASLRWAYRFYYAPRALAIADTNNDGNLDVLVSVADGYLYQISHEQFSRPGAVWDGVGQTASFDIDVQSNRACYSARWSAVLGATSYRVVLRDQTGYIMATTELSDAAANRGGTLRGIDLCGLSLLSGRQYFVEVIAAQGSLSSGPATSDGVTIQDTGDLATSRKSSNKENYDPGEVITYTIVLTNSGPITALAQLLDPVPVNTTFVNGSLSATAGTATYNAAQQRVEWDSGAAGIAPGGRVTLTFAVQISPTFLSGLIRNVAQVFEVVGGQIVELERTVAVNTSNLSDSSKAVDRATALLGDTLRYTVTVRNSGSAAASGVIVDDLLPAGLSYVGGSASANLPGAITQYSQSGRTGLRWSGTLAPGQILTFTLQAQVNVASAILDNCATVRDTLNGSFQRCARTVVGAGGPSLVSSYKTSDRLNYATTDQITYTIMLVNNGTQVAPNVQLHDPLPSGLSAIQADTSAGTLNVSGNVVSWNGVVVPGQPVSITIRANLNRPDGVMKNTAIVTDVAQNRVYTLTREVLVGTTPALNGEKFAQPASARAGEQITYTIRLENTGNAVAANAVMTDPLPAGTSYVAGSAVTNRGVVTYNTAQQQLEWSGPVWITAPTFITWRVQVEPSAPIGSIILNEARSFDGVADVDTFVATTAVDVPAGKALIRTLVYSGTGTTPMSGVLVSASGLATVTASTNASGYAGLLVDATVTPTNYAVFQVVPAGYVNLTPNPVGVPGVVEGGVYNVVFRNGLSVPGFGWVRGVVFNDANGDGQRNIFTEVGLGDVTVSASDGQTMQTLFDGSYFFHLAAGARTVTQTNLPGWVSTTPDVVAVTVASQGAHQVDFGDWQCPPGLPVCIDPPPGYAWLFGYVYRDVDATLNAPDGLMGTSDEPLASASVNASVGASSANASSDTGGFYYMEVPVGTGAVTLTVPGGYIALTPPSVPFHALDGGRVRVDFGVISNTQCAAGTGVVNGFVYSDTTPVGQFVLGLDGPTLTESTVSFGSQSQRTNWMYAFACVPSGSAVVTATNPAGYTNTTPEAVSVTVPSQDAVSANFGKAFQNIPISLRYAYVPIVRRP